MVEYEKISGKDNKLSFLLKKSSPAYANALRRIMLTEVPVMAMENIEFKSNSSALYDEVLAHRLGLIPLTTDLKSYDLPESDEDVESKKAKCTLQLTLKEKGPKTVYSGDLKSADPKVKPVHEGIPIVKLLKDQQIEFTATAILGKGTEHVKWSAGHIYYTYNPKIIINKKADVEKVRDMYPPQAFDKKGQFDEKAIIANNLVDAVAHTNEEVIKVEYNDTEFIFNVESWGQLKPTEIVKESLKVFDQKLDELNSQIK
jgi:DNA-directed RNA polymerase subunit D